MPESGGLKLDWYGLRIDHFVPKINIHFKYQPLKNVCTSGLERTMLVIVDKLRITFFMNRDSVQVFPYIKKNPWYATISEYFTTIVLLRKCHIYFLHIYFYIWLTFCHDHADPAANSSPVLDMMSNSRSFIVGHMYFLPVKFWP